MKWIEEKEFKVRASQKREKGMRRMERERPKGS